MKIEVSYFDIYIKLECNENEYTFNNDEVMDKIQKVAEKVIDIYMADKQKENKNEH